MWRGEGKVKAEGKVTKSESNIKFFIKKKSN